MGQGTESCHGYDHDYNPYEKGVSNGDWTQRDGSTINVSKMTVRHMKNAMAIVKKAAHEATFESDIELWQDWVNIFEKEIASRVQPLEAKPAASASKASKKARGSKVIMVCHCGQEYEARSADVARGWGLSCSKRCAGIRREYGRPAATPKK